MKRKSEVYALNLFENKGNDKMMDVDRTFEKQFVITQLKESFQSYGYDEITTSVFGHYDLYAQMNGTVNHQEMIKTIDNTGQVLVLRPDVTIPLTERLARQTKQIPTDVRYFYVLDVYRQAAVDGADRESTQAGVEYLGNKRPQADAEIIALAIDTLKEFGIEQMTIELGHAGFFKQLVSELQLSKQELQELTAYIQAKNVPELEMFTEKLDLQPSHQQIIQSLPFLYGKQQDVMEKVEQLPLSEALRKTLNNLSAVFDVLVAYEVDSYIVIDLSLINHMDYYSDIIFQGFIEKAGKPIVMGGRYDTLSEQFGAEIPAIGFAFDVHTLFEHIPDFILPIKESVDYLIRYTEDKERDALRLAKQLRQKQYSVLTYPAASSNTSIQKTKHTIERDSHTFMIDHSTSLQTAAEVIQFIESKER